jgi:hypothetical protein
LGGRADANARDVGLGHFSQHPHARQVDDREQGRRRIDGSADGDAAIHDHAASRGDDRDQPTRLTGLFDGVDVCWRHPEHSEAHSPAGKDHARDARRGDVLPRREILGLR